MTTTCIRREHSYWTTCQCDTCRTERLRKVKRYHALGYRRPSSERAWQRVDKWVAAGFTAHWIASAAGMNDRGIETALQELRDTGHRRAFGPITAQRILTADIWAATSGRCDATGTRRRLQALAVIGWDTGRLSDETGVSFVSLCAIRRGEVNAINPGNRNAVAAIYERLQGTPGPSGQARTRARNKGWVGPLAWDDIDNDPEPPAVEYRPRNLLAEYEHLTGLGESHEQACKQLGVSSKAIDKARARARKAA